MASILAISASQSGPAHSFIVGEALKSAAARAGHTLGLKVISHLGEQGSFSDDDLAKADVAVVVADGPVDLSDLPKTLRIFETTPQAVFDDADGVVAQALAGSAGAAKAAPATGTAAPGGKPPAGMKVVAITSCPTGVAHTFMAAEALEEGAEAAGYTIKVETRGSVGAQNTLTPEEIAAADLVVIASWASGSTAPAPRPPFMMPARCSIRPGPKPPPGGMARQPPQAPRKKPRPAAAVAAAPTST